METFWITLMWNPPPRLYSASSPLGTALVFYNIFFHLYQTACIPIIPGLNLPQTQKLSEFFCRLVIALLRQTQKLLRSMCGVEYGRWLEVYYQEKICERVERALCNNIPGRRNIDVDGVSQAIYKITNYFLDINGIVGYNSYGYV
jgi:hypothetical protein